MNPISTHHKFSIAITIVLLVHSPASADWTNLFNGTDLTGWRIGENPDSFSVQDGLMVADGPRAHAFYVGPDGAASFKDFVFETEVFTTYGANSGIYFHTHYQSEDWPSTGYEAQINQTHEDPKKTGGLYGVQDNYAAVAQDYEWFDYQITVSGKRIVLKIDGRTITDYTEPNDLDRPWRQLGQGTFAIQAHDPWRPVYFRNMRVQSIPEPSTLAILGIGLISVAAVRRRKVCDASTLLSVALALGLAASSARADILYLGSQVGTNHQVVKINSSGAASGFCESSRRRQFILTELRLTSAETYMRRTLTKTRLPRSLRPGRQACSNRFPAARSLPG